MWAKRATNNDLPNKHVAAACRKLGLQVVLQSGDAYFTVVFDTTENRDNAFGILRTKRFRLSSEVVALLVMLLGV